jgi:hypothetical protein
MLTGDISMTLKIYVAKDSNGRGRTPDTSHEVRAIEWMLKKAWSDFHHLQETYAIIVNLRHPSADMVVFTERGLGLLELKHKYGEIKINTNGIWMAGTSVIKAGKHQNPREQVRSYAKELREKVIRWILPTYIYANKDCWNMLKFETGVCFTHPDANILNAQKHINERHTFLEPWESNFSIIDIDGFTAWIRELRFQLQHDHEHSKDFEHVRLSPEMIVKIATELLGNVEWNEIYAAMPDGYPYGYLILEDAKGKQVFKLVKDHLIIGRSPECDVVIPERYSRVSKIHCSITRTMCSIELVDLESSNGTFLNWRPIEKSSNIQHGNILLLGGESIVQEDVCALKFEAREQISLEVPATKISTYIVQKDDTISGIANKFETTVDNLLALNPDIKDPNLLFAGWILRVW